MGSDSMGQTSLNRRDLLSGAALLAMGVPLSARAQQDRLFGIAVPEQLTALLPADLTGYARIAEGLVALESDAGRRRLPPTPLAFDSGLPLTDLAGALYRAALPRLVALIDRSERIDPGFAERAGGLLAELHQTQFVLGAALAGAPQGYDGAPLSAVPHLDDGPLMSPGTRAVPDVDDHDDDFAAAPAGPAPAYVFTPPDTVAALPAPDLPAPDVPEPAPPPPPPSKPTALPPLSRARDYASLAAEYGRMFRELNPRTDYADSIGWHLTMLRNAKPRYERVGNQVGVPWHFIGVIHALEASFNFRAHLHNGDHPLHQRTRQVPSGRPLTWLPPADWESSAKDALRLLGFTGKTDWSLERTLYRLEAYNGFGYRGLGVPTPYLWSFSDHYAGGKFVADGKFNGKAKSQQCGTAVMLKALADAGDIVLTHAT
jgi:lysozyme family protein